MGTIKDRNGMGLTEAEDIKRRWQEYTEKLYKKDLHDPDNHDGVITHLEPDIPECEVKWTLGSITMNKAFLLCLSLLFFSQLFVWSPQTTILPFGNVMNLRPKLFWHSVCQIYFKIFFLLLPQFDGFIFIIYLK